MSIEWLNYMIIVSNNIVLPYSFGISFRKIIYESEKKQVRE